MIKRFEDRIFKVPYDISKWLFIFGPTTNCSERHFRAFTIGKDLTVEEITGDTKVVPEEWSK